MLHFLRLRGQWAINGLRMLGRAGVMIWLALVRWPERGFLGLLVRQIHAVGVLSVIIIVLSAFSVGAVLGLQFYTQLARFGAESAVGLGVAVVLVRELGPVVTALLFAGRAGSALTAEIGLMKATDQLAAMEMMGVDPLARIVSPRLWAGFISMPLLASMFSVVAIFGAAVVGVNWLGIDDGTFWSGMQDGVDFEEDVVRGALKALVFGVVVTWIAVFQGYDCVPTAEGISAATTRTVVYGSVAVLALDFVLTLVMFAEFG